MDEGLCLKRLAEMALLVPSRDRPERERFVAYYLRLQWIDDDVFNAVMDRIERTSTFFPSLPELLKRTFDVMQERGLIESPEDAWRRLRREAGRYTPETRPRPLYSNPVTEMAVRSLGGPVALLHADQRGLAIMERDFRSGYPEWSMSDEQLSFVRRYGRWAVPVPATALELPHQNVDRRMADSLLSRYDREKLPNGTNVLRTKADRLYETERPIPLPSEIGVPDEVDGGGDVRSPRKNGRLLPPTAGGR